MKIGAVILAAGYSSRMGGFKPLMRLGNRTMLACCADFFREAGIIDILVITGYRGQDIVEEARRAGLRSIHNPEYERGMFSSVCAAAGEMRNMDGFFLQPVDIPLLYPATIRTLLESFDGSHVTVPSSSGRAGHPPLIPGQLIPKILAYNGSGGLAGLMARKSRRFVTVWDRGILLDADGPEDFAVLKRRQSRMDIGEPEEAIALAALAMPEKGVAHGREVAQVAVKLGRELNRCDLDLDLDLIHNAALLHDIAKGKPQHEEQGGRQLEELGLGRLAHIVKAHRYAEPPAAGELTEKELVCLADKLVRGTQKMTLHQRFGEKLRDSNDVSACREIEDRLEAALLLQEIVEQKMGRQVEALIKEYPS